MVALKLATNEGAKTLEREKRLIQKQPLQPCKHKGQLLSYLKDHNIFQSKTSSDFIYSTTIKP